jgi:D-beta-D-heptose 7-phosphate kinase/D-beta-D-heptose 1-phosphate adenosyltransferase
MLDRYWRGPASRISPEAPVPVVRIREQEDRIGGAGNVAANAVALGARVTLVGLTGADADADALEALCNARGLRAQLLREPAATTTVKLRVMAQHQQLLRVDFEDEPQTLSPAVAARLEPLLRSTLEKDSATRRAVVVFSDYAKGALAAVSSLLGCARAYGAFCIVDPKGRDFARYQGADLLTPNLGEFEAVVGVCADLPTLVTRARELCARHALGAVLVTRGEAGMSLVTAAGEALHLSAVARDVFDVTGAGDTVCAALAWAIAAGDNLSEAVRLANSAAGIAVGKLGTAVVTRAELARVDSDLPARRHQILDRVTLLERVAEARARGERIVMTNGCFDILHVGHVRYLEAAAALGDRLIVAINTDASVRRLKGPRRPVNALADRMEVLQRLSAVDWVVPFDEDTPRDLIAAVLPDILVKGGDYEVAAIAGAAEVQAAGGQVLTLPFHAGHSTTAMLARAADDASETATS